MMRSKDDNGPFAWFIFAEAVMILLYGLFTRYDDKGVNTDVPVDNAALQDYYAMYQDVHVMIFVGFGFLMTFLRKYGYGAVGLTFFLSSFVVQWSILVRGFWERVFHRHFDKINLNVLSLINADFAAGAVMISFGAVIGKLSPIQLLVMAVLEVIVYALNEAILMLELKVVDVGGSMVIHTFGAYFGLGVAWVTGRALYKGHKDNSSVYHANLFSFIGTLFLWLFWPSFNAAISTSAANGHHRAVVNTLLSISTSSIVAFFVSSALRKRRFEVMDIQNATLAGGVAIGASANLYTTPWGAMFVGLVAGTFSTLGFARLLPYLLDRINLYDTCGVHNLHGIPGIIGGVAGAIFAGLATTSNYGSDLTVVFPARANRSATEQAGYQMVALITTIGISLVSGLAVGKILKTFFRNVETPYSDESHWLMPEEEIPHYFTEEPSQSIPARLSNTHMRSPGHHSPEKDHAAHGNGVSNGNGVHSPANPTSVETQM